MGVLAYFLLLWGGLYLYHEYVQRGRAKRRRRLNLLAQHLRERLAWDADIMPPARQQVLASLAQEAETLGRGETAEGPVADLMKRANGELSRGAPTGLKLQLRELMELLVVVLGVVMGIRALYIQPFKIPTGSMQPTLFGIHFEPSEQAPNLAWYARVWRYMSYGERGVAVQARAEGQLRTLQSVDGLTTALFPETLVTIGQQSYRVPGEPGNVQRYLNGRDYYQVGETLAQGYLVDGDHLFVDRVSFHFTNPRRGDITVFVTDGITYNGKPLNGRYYIKRLVGLPGETLRLHEGHLQVLQRDGEIWRTIGPADHEAFGRLASLTGGYRGYYQPGFGEGANFLTREKPQITLGDDEYWLMGDNSENSLDSRYWGPVPRRNLVGRAIWVWWPFSRRWGLADHAEPLEFASPPTRGTNGRHLE